MEKKTPDIFECRKRKLEGGGGAVEDVLFKAVSESYRAPVPQQWQIVPEQLTTNDQIGSVGHKRISFLITYFILSTLFRPF